MIKTIYPVDETWDYLLILDACRYDYFEKVQDEFLDGSLEKVISPGSNTSEWCNKIFREKYNDIVYISGNPKINSKIEVGGFDAKKHFYEIVDVWDFGWDDEYRTTPPGSVNRALLKAIKKYPEKRIIAHYMQPHGPYLDSELSKADDGPLKVNPKIKDSFSWRLGQKVVNLLGQKWVWKFRDLMGVPPQSHVYEVYKEKGEEGLWKVYENNLRIVLEHISKIVNKLEGKAIITADHGELLGEDGKFGHCKNSSNPLLREVPWFAVE